MRLLHFSDNHGLLTPLRDRDTCDVVVSSGDFLPNRTRGIRAVEESFQPAWLDNNKSRLRDFFGDSLLLFCPGNHDFIDPVPQLQSFGIRAENIVDRRYELDGYVFWGFPCVKWFTGEWNYEVSEREIECRLDAMDNDVDILVSHGPPHGVRDRNQEGERCGSVSLRNHLKECSKPPKWVLCGHIHEAAGVQRWSRNIDISNAACTQRIITLPTKFESVPALEVGVDCHVVPTAPYSGESLSCL